MPPSRALLAALIALAAAAAGGEELARVAGRDGVSQPYLLAAPAGRPLAAAVLFPGGNGAIRLREEDGGLKFAGGNFLVRARGEFVARGVAVAVLDAPADQAAGMNDAFRLGAAHAADVTAVVGDLRARFAGAPMFLVGTSRGTLSAAAAGRALGSGVDGVVLTASLFLPSRAGPGLSGFDFATIEAPLLFVHHAADACDVTPYASAQPLAARYALITVNGGDPPRSKPCDALSRHGFLGREGDTVGEIVNWMLRKPHRAVIE